MKNLFFLFLMISIKLSSQVNYNVPSHDWENYHADWIDLYQALSSNGFEYDVLSHGNTSSAYADFNFDGYQDIMIYSNLADGENVNKHFLIYDENTENFNISVDINFIDSSEARHSRKTIVGDFNGDGKPDVVRPQGAHDVGLGKPTITLSNSDNSYTFKLIGDGPDIQSHTVCSGDIDNDGDLDLFFAQSGEQDGFLINDGNANFTWKWISEIIEGFDDGFLYPDGNFGPHGIWSSEMTDVDKDGYVDLIIGGSYQNEVTQPHLEGPSIFWGNDSGKFFVNNSTTLFNDLDGLDYLPNGNRISVSHDYAVNDIDGDGINDIAIFSETRVEETALFQVFKGLGNREFEDMTVEWLPNYYRTSDDGSQPGYVWIILRDIDNNGQIDLVESQPRIHQVNSVIRNSLHWEWNGSFFSNTQLSVDDEILENSLKLYPNPTDNTLFIKGNKNLMKVSVYNMLGKEVLSKMNTNNIDVNVLPKGVYIIKISDDVGQINRKFIKN